MELRFPHKNKTKSLSTKQRYSEATMNRIQEICKYDIEQYNFAKNEVVGQENKVGYLNVVLLISESFGKTNVIFGSLQPLFSNC